ncbi:hypothetical protein [Fusibacter sp. JL216-2]|uniref:hypothetical protein n=1 Tax=Fusibacter sp. JL216-2 TaxID=3071453 RepID=UPI003D34966A
MKKMTCKQLGGACDLEFKAETFEEMAELSKNHGMEMLEKGDKAHLEAMNEMKKRMKNEGAMQDFMRQMKQAFDATPEE